MTDDPAFVVIEPHDVRASAVLRRPDGFPHLFAAELRGAVYDDEGAKLADRLLPADLDALVRQYRYTSTLGPPRFPSVITGIWVVPDDAPVPPQFILQGMKEEIAAGNTILLLASVRSARDQAKVAISDFLARRAAR